MNKKCSIIIIFLLTLHCIIVPGTCGSTLLPDTPYRPRPRPYSPQRRGHTPPATPHKKKHARAITKPTTTAVVKEERIRTKEPKKTAPISTVKKITFKPGETNKFIRGTKL